jgi:hypothetical protein
VFASDELAVIKRAAARDLEKIPRPDNDDFVSSRPLDRRRHAPGASFDEVDSAVEVIPFRIPLMLRILRSFSQSLIALRPC